MPLSGLHLRRGRQAARPAPSERQPDWLAAAAASPAARPTTSLSFDCLVMSHELIPEFLLVRMTVNTESYYS